jgi:hypothetical protein
MFLEVQKANPPQNRNTFNPKRSVIFGTFFIDESQGNSNIKKSMAMIML